MIDIRHLIAAIRTTVEAHSLGRPGAYRRWLWQNAQGDRDLDLNEYGCADAANILYTIGELPVDPTERGQWVSVMLGMQDATTGLFHEKTHHEIHTTAHCTAALNLFDARPAHPLAALARLRDKSTLEAFLDKLRWSEDPWRASHQGAGIYASLVLAGEASLQWQDWYFAWLWNEADPATGFWRRGHIHADSGDVTIFHDLAGSFHYLFNHEYAHRPLRYPERMVESCLRIWQRGLQRLGRPERGGRLGAGIGFADIDWIYCLSRSLRQCGHRFGESQAALREMAEGYISYLQSVDAATDEGWNDLHALFGATCALAELQQAVPGLLKTETPLRLVLDRRPFI